MTVGERIKNLREQLGIRQVDFADKLSVSKQTLYKYENNIITNIPFDKIEAAAKIGNVSPAYLMGWDCNISPVTNGPKRKASGVTINILRRLAANVPIDAAEDIIDTEEIAEELASTGSFFGLQIHGDSMEPKISEGDVVIVRQQDDAKSGDIVIALMDGEEATCRRLRKYRDGIELISSNPAYAPVFFSNEEIEKKSVKIIGRVMELRARLW